MPKTSSPIWQIAQYTLADDIRQKSFIVLGAVCALAILLIRGCYSGQVMVNGQALDAETVIRAMSQVMFHLIAAGSMFLAALIAMRALRRDRDEGMQAAILSKPIKRRQYVAGKIVGLWGLSAFFMFVLHGLVFLISSVGMGAALPQYLAASLISFLNLLFVIVAVLLLSLVLPDVMAFLCVTAIAGVSFVSDGIFAVSQSTVGQSILQQGGSESGISGWKVFYWLWPQISGAQRFASSLPGWESFPGWAAFYPLLNILVYIAVFGAILFWRFDREDIV